MAKRKPTPLQYWRQVYAELVFSNRCAKKAARGGHTWGDFKRPQAQRMAAGMKIMCREWMAERESAANATAILWETDAIRRAVRLGHPIPNSRDPGNKIED